ncbi:MAG: EscR/YscR/HrcR family type III secretion system export apparatus protein, partial [Lachnospiraceae bacterium]|nr:EscR/YscR/HrcR family type III secretion system export apparatus protein [Lachnospiraceae bacterium]
MVVVAAEPGTTDHSTILRPTGTVDEMDELMEPNVDESFTITVNNGNGELNGSLRILLTLTLIAIAPILLIMLTCYTRVIIVLHFTRAALNTQTAPPNQVLIGLALFLTFFIMTPTIERVQTEALEPFDAGEITQEEFFEAALVPIRGFMYEETLVKDVQLFMDIAEQEWDGTLEDIPTSILVPSFVIGELRQAFIIGFVIYIPFIVID